MKGSRLLQRSACSAVLGHPPVHLSSQAALEQGKQTVDSTEQAGQSQRGVMRARLCRDRRDARGAWGRPSGGPSPVHQRQQHHAEQTDHRDGARRWRVARARRAGWWETRGCESLRCCPHLRLARGAHAIAPTGSRAVTRASPAGSEGGRAWSAASERKTRARAGPEPEPARWTRGTAPPGRRRRQAGVGPCPCLPPRARPHRTEPSPTRLRRWPAVNRPAQAPARGHRGARPRGTAGTASSDSPPAP